MPRFTRIDARSLRVILRVLMATLQEAIEASRELLEAAARAADGYAGSGPIRDAATRIKKAARDLSQANP